jgi:hypothetical protein
MPKWPSCAIVKTDMAGLYIAFLSYVSWLTKWLALQMPERISSVVFANAIVLSTGESFFTNRVGGLGAVPLHALFTAVFGAPVWPLEPDTPLGFLEKDAWQTVFMNTREHDEVGNTVHVSLVRPCLMHLHQSVCHPTLFFCWFSRGTTVQFSIMAEKCALSAHVLAAVFGSCP